MKKVLHVESLSVHIEQKGKKNTLVSDVSFSILEGETFAIIGESGSGKTTLALSLMRLLPSAFTIEGNVFLDDVNILSLPPSKMRRIRGKDISLVFQDPDSSLNPVFTIGDQVAESFEIHENVSQEEAEQKAIDMLRLVGIPHAEKAFEIYPHQLSGGMKQRAMIAIAISSKPKLLILDEPTTALDVTVQREILSLIHELQHILKMTMLVISHDMGVVAEMADHVGVMYASCMIEKGPLESVFKQPHMAYTKALFLARPTRKMRKQRLPIGSKG